MAKTTIRLQCHNCGGELTIDPQKEILACPFCGSKELITDSDVVEVEKIRQQSAKIMSEKSKNVPHTETAKQELCRLFFPLSAAVGVSAAFRQLAIFTRYYMEPFF